MAICKKSSVIYAVDTKVFSFYIFKIAYCETEVDKHNNQKLKLNDLTFFFAFMKDEGRLDSCPNTLVSSGL